MDLDVTEAAMSVPAEWVAQKCIWTAWPADPASGTAISPRRAATWRRWCARSAPANTVRLLVNGAEAEASARGRRWAMPPSSSRRATATSGCATPGRFSRVTPRAPLRLRFETNSWGGKYDLPDDATVGDDIARLAGTPIRRFGFVLEGGAVDHDGEGTILTTRQTLLNPNRNGWTQGGRRRRRSPRPSAPARSSGSTRA